LRAESERNDLPGAYSLNDRYETFKSAVPQICERLKLKADEMTFVDFCQAVLAFLDDEKNVRAVQAEQE
jgi:hypothetical protein